MTYLPDAYPSHVASVLAGSTLVRASGGAAFPLFGRGYFDKLGIGAGSSILAGVALLMMPFLWALIRWGDSLRRRSRYATRS